MGKSRAAARTIKILELVASTNGGLTLSEIAAQLDIPITSVNDIIKSLVDEEMLDLIDPRSKVYGIGVKAFYIGNAFIEYASLIDVAKPVAQELGQILNKTVFVAKHVRGEVTYLYKYEPEVPVVATCAIGSRATMHDTALGKSIMAFDDEVLEGLKEKPLPRVTNNTITNHDVLRADLDRVRARGYAIDNREHSEHLFCIGAPIFDAAGNVVAALSASGLYSPDIDVEYQGGLVKDKALLISRKLGWREGIGA